MNIQDLEPKVVWKNFYALTQIPRPSKHEAQVIEYLYNWGKSHGFETIKACTAYKVNGKLTRDFPYDIEHDVVPIYSDLPGWMTDMTHFTREEQFPQQFKDYIAFLEKELETPITIISIGPDREQTILRK